jgi:hypothetical protein
MSVARTLRVLVGIALVAVALVTVAACDGSTPARDAGLDAGPDAGRADAARDAGPRCALECDPAQTCCRDPDGTTLCANLRNDPRHCGLCEIDCIASHRGDGCSASQCTCGSTSLGCTGNRQSWCCPGRSPGSSAYCADLDRSPADCGACGAGCDARTADRCDGGRCVCGDERAPCSGGLVCCSNGVDVGCTDVATDEFHCGGCDRVCAAGQRCEHGACTVGEATCPGGCARSEICCNGSCCTAERCTAGSCGG